MLTVIISMNWLTKKETLRLRTRHCRLRHHLNQKLKIWPTDLCGRDKEQQTQHTHSPELPAIQPTKAKDLARPDPPAGEVLGDAENLRQTAIFVRHICDDA